MAKQERTRVTDPQAKVRMNLEANDRIQPWSELNADEKRIFDGLVGSREKSTWTDADRELVTKLARITVELDKLWDAYVAEGPVITNDRGTPIENPRLRAYNSLSQIYKAMRTTLGLSASQRGISGHKQAKRNEAEVEAKQTGKKGAVGGVSLLAVPGR